MHSAKEILEIVKQRGLNVSEFSRQTGILAPRIYKWLEGKGRPKVEDAQKLVNWGRKYLDKVLNEPPAKTVHDPLPLGDTKVTLKDYLEEIKQQKEFLQDLLIHRVGEVDFNLKTVVGKAEGLQFDLISGREIVLKALARLEKKPPLTLLNEADKLRADLAEQADKLSKRNVAGK